MIYLLSALLILVLVQTFLLIPVCRRSRQLEQREKQETASRRRFEQEQREERANRLRWSGPGEAS